MHKISFRDRLKYRFDSFMSRGTGALILALFLFSLAIILVASGVVTALNLDGGDGDFPTLMWNNLNRIIDAGYLGGDEGGWPFLLLMLAVTAGGIFIFSTLIGVLTTGLEAKIEQLRKGRSFVAETGHTVILGWSPQIFSVVGELILANESLKRACIAILADKDKVEMEDELRDKFPDTRVTKLVCRTGDPVDMDDLAIVNPEAARSVIVLPESGPGADAEALKTVLALTSILGGGGPHLSAVLRNASTLPAAKVAGAGKAVFLTVTEIIARITAQTSRQSGLSVVVTDVLDFAGDEIYFYPAQALASKSFLEAAHAFENCAAMGLRRASGKIELNPAMDAVVEADDQVILLAEDEDKIALASGAKQDVDQTAIQDHALPASAPEKTLVLGWNPMGPPLLKCLDGYVASGSTIAVAAAAPPNVDVLKAMLANMDPSCRAADITDRAVLEELAGQGFDQVVLLGDPTLTPGRADARTLTTLLHLRDIADKQGQNFPMITEIFDPRTQQLARAARADDFIVSDRLLSLMLAQVSENPELATVFEELFSPQGAEFYLRPAELYLKPGATVTFHTAIEAAARKGETAVGYRLGRLASDPEENYGVRLNPAKSESLRLTAGDCLIVLADD